MFPLKVEHLEQLCRLNEFPVAGDEMVFVGVRGCLPENPVDHAFRDVQALSAALPVDHVHPRCTLIQWMPLDKQFAVYPGSTVPHRRYIQGALAGGEQANQLLTGFFADYRKGMHKAGKPTGHAAFRETGMRVFRRTHNDAEFGVDDPVEFDNPFDNLHAAWCFNTEEDLFSSAGCQVVVGFPQCPKRGNQPSTGPWKAFVGTAYGREQVSFGYALFNGSADVKQMAQSGPEGLERVRFGSSGPRARRVQAALREGGYYEGDLDGRFGYRSLRALIDFQQIAFGPSGGDGICGPQTAAALEIDWP
jgi:hypothetical protein